MRHQRVLVIGMAGGFDAEKLSGLGLGPSAPINSCAAQFPPVAQGRRSRRHRLRPSPARAPSSSTAPAVRAACRHCHCRAWPSTMYPRFGSPISAQSKRSDPFPVRFTARIPDAHALVRMHPLRRQRLPDSADACSNRSDARLKANTRKSQSAPAGVARPQSGPPPEPRVPAHSTCA